MNEVTPREPFNEKRKYIHEEGSMFIRCVDKVTGDLLFIITAGRVENAEDIMNDLYNGEYDGG